MHIIIFSIRRKARQYLEPTKSFALHILMQIFKVCGCKFSRTQTPLGQVKRAGLRQLFILSRRHAIGYGGKLLPYRP